MSDHRLTIVDRGQQHRHRFYGVCSCDDQWVSVNRRRRQEVEDMYRDHKDAKTRGHRIPGAPAPRPDPNRNNRLTRAPCPTR